jgi:hypothetical protein
MPTSKPLQTVCLAFLPAYPRPRQCVGRQSRTAKKMRTFAPRELGPKSRARFKCVSQKAAVSIPRSEFVGLTRTHFADKAALT